jgi:hypothetical protein
VLNEVSQIAGLHSSLLVECFALNDTVLNDTVCFALNDTVFNDTNDAVFDDTVLNGNIPTLVLFLADKVTS